MRGGKKGAARVCARGERQYIAFARTGLPLVDLNGQARMSCQSGLACAVSASSSSQQNGPQ